MTRITINSCGGKKSSRKPKQRITTAGHKAWLRMMANK